MRVLITGGAGFLGRRLLSALLARASLPDAGGREQTIERICIADIGDGGVALPDDPRVTTAFGDFSEPGAARQLLDGDTGVVFHLAAIVSGQAEQEFDTGMRINFDGTRRLLDACRELPRPARLVFSSSVAVYGGELPDLIGDDTPAVPQTSYGAQKVACEILLNDYARKGFVDARALRLPTIIVRPGKPNAAASSFASSILREPLQGAETVCPVAPDTGVWALSPRRVAESFVHAATLPGSDWGDNRSVMLPGLTVTVREMLHALGEIAGAAAVARVRFETDPFVEKIVYGWPTRFDARRAQAMGFRADYSIAEIIQAFIEDDLNGQFVA